MEETIDTKGLVLWLPRNISDKWYDWSGENNNGTIHNATVTELLCEQCMNFEAENAYVECGHDISLDITDAVTLEMWLKETKRVATGKTVCRREGLKFYFMGSYNGYAKLLIGDGTDYDYITATSQIDLDTWYHMLGVYDVNAGAGKQGRIYINGNLDKEGELLYNIGAMSIANLEIGRYATDSFNGLIGEVRIYNWGLMAEESRRLYEITKTYYGH